MEATHPESSWEISVECLTDVIPNLELIIGPQPDIPELGGIRSSKPL